MSSVFTPQENGNCKVTSTNSVITCSQTGALPGIDGGGIQKLMNDTNTMRNEGKKKLITKDSVLRLIDIMSPLTE